MDITAIEMLINKPLIRLESLEEIAKAAPQGDANSQLLILCLQGAVRVYFQIPTGHVAAVFQNSLIDLREHQVGARPIVEYPGQAYVEHAIKWIAVDPADLKHIRDTGLAIVELHVSGGLLQRDDGLVFRSFEHCVICKDSPASSYLPRDPWPQKLTRGLEFPTKHTIKFADLFVSTEDGAALKVAIEPKGVTDKWGHETAAPNVFRLYQLSQQPYNSGEVETLLIEGDTSGVFIKAVAEAASRILKIDVRRNAEKGFKVEMISDNPMKKDYSDPRLSKRMSLLLLATDCWIHDQELHNETEKQLEPERRSVKEVSEKLAGSEKLKELELLLAHKEMIAKSRLSQKLHMPAGLEKYLRSLGFSSNQANHFVRIIKGSAIGGVHVATRKGARAKANSIKKSGRS